MNINLSKKEQTNLLHLITLVNTCMNCQKEFAVVFAGYCSKAELKELKGYGEKLFKKIKGVNK